MIFDTATETTAGLPAIFLAENLEKSETVGVKSAKKLKKIPRGEVAGFLLSGKIFICISRQPLMFNLLAGRTLFTVTCTVFREEG